MGDFRNGVQPSERLENALAPEALAALNTCIELATARRLSLYLVGGAVRDLALARNHIDLDIAIEGEPAGLANELALCVGGKAVLHPRFGTATVSSPGFQVDLAQTRRETYVRPGALPQVEPAALLEDLGRRDFSINAVALRLTEPKGEIIDPFSGLDDLSGGILRALHQNSFKDDATRVLRGVRYASRLQFRFEEYTEEWLMRDTAYLEKISGPRLRRELAFIFEETEAPAAALKAQQYGALGAISPELGTNEDIGRRWRSALGGSRHALLDELGFCLLAAPSTAGESEAVSRRLHLTGRVDRVLTEFVRLRDLSAKLAEARADPAAVVDLLDRFPAAAIWALSVIEGGATGEACDSYLGSWRHVRPRLRGNDLLALGVEPGVAIGEALSLLRRARLEGRVETRDDEIELIKVGQNAARGVKKKNGRKKRAPTRPEG